MRLKPARAGSRARSGQGRTGENGMKILVLFRWAKKRMTVLLEIRFLA
jgi:hypothetical protein